MSTSSTHKATQKATGSGIVTWMPCQNLDRLLRNYRDYLEATYGMWSYVNAPYIKALSEYLHGRPTLEIMAGNGYISSGLRNLRPAQTIFATDSTDWTKENETGKHPVTTIEPLDALAAIEKVWQSSRLCHHVMVARQAGN